MKVAWKIALYNLVFHQLPLIQDCSIFYKKNAFQSTKKFRRIQWQNMLRMHLLHSRISKFSGGGPSGSPPLVPATLGACLWVSTLPLLYKLRPLLQFFLRTLQYNHFNIECTLYYCFDVKNHSNLNKYLYKTNKDLYKNCHYINITCFQHFRFFFLQQTDF